jgi:hypothetical protein
MIGVVTLLATLVTGGVTAGRRAAPLAATLAAYAALVLVWPYSPGRFVWAILPFAAVGVVAASRGLRVRLRNRGLASGIARGAAHAVAAVAAIAFIALAVSDARGLRHRWHAMAIEQNAEAFLVPLSWIAQNTSPDDVVASDVHLPAYLYLGRTSVPVSTLTVSEHITPKPATMQQAEIGALDSAYHPSWWVIGEPGLAGSFRTWAARTPSVGIVATLPGGGVVARRR